MVVLKAFSLLMQRPHGDPVLRGSQLEANVLRLHAGLYVL